MKYVLITLFVVIILVLIALFRGSSPKRTERSSRSSSGVELRQFGELRLQDFETHPVWVNCHVIDYNESWYEETDEETFRPWDKELPVDPAETMFLVKATLIMADGTEMPGFITPQLPSGHDSNLDLGIVQPYLFLADEAMTGFWYGLIHPSPKEVDDFYSALGKSRHDVFPITFKADDGLATGLVTGSIPGFCSRGNHNDINVIQ